MIILETMLSTNIIYCVLLYLGQAQDQAAASHISGLRDSLLIIQQPTSYHPPLLLLSSQQSNSDWQTVNIVPEIFTVNATSWLIYNLVRLIMIYFEKIWAPYVGKVELKDSGIWWQVDEQSETRLERLSLNGTMGVWNKILPSKLFHYLDFSAKLKIWLFMNYFVCNKFF